MKSEKTNLKDRIKNYLADIIVGYILPFICSLPSIILILGLIYTMSLAYPDVHNAKCKEINCIALAFNIPDWFYIGLKIYISIFFGISAIGLIEALFNKKIIDDKTMRNIIHIYLVINLIFVLIIEYLNGWSLLFRW